MVAVGRAADSRRAAPAFDGRPGRVQPGGHVGDGRPHRRRRREEGGVAVGVRAEGPRPLWDDAARRRVAAPLEAPGGRYAGARVLRARASAARHPRPRWRLFPIDDAAAPGSYDIPADFDLDGFDQVLVDISFEPRDGVEAHSGASIVRGPVTDV